MEMWFPEPDDGMVEKKFVFPTQLLARMRVAAREAGMDEETYVLSAVEESLARRRKEMQEDIMVIFMKKEVYLLFVFMIIVIWKIFIK